jgi:hypothetical protein
VKYNKPLWSGPESPEPTCRGYCITPRSFPSNMSGQ